MNAFRADNFHLEKWLPAGIGIDDFIAFLAGLAVVAVFFAVWNALRASSPFERRFADIAQRKESLRRSALAARRQPRERLTPAGLMNEAVKRLNLLRSKHATDARMLLMQAGLRSRDAMIRYLFARVSLPLVFAVAEMADAYTIHVIPVPERFRFVGALVAALVGYIAPSMVIKNLTTRRVKLMQKGLPDALDLMVICAEAGLSLDATLNRVSRELEASWPELAEEFGITAAELTFLPERRQAFDNLNARTNMASIRGVVNTLVQTAKFGTPLAQSLRVLSAEFRDARMIRAEEKAARLPALLTVPLILFILPTLFIVLLGPAVLNIIDTFSGNKKGPQHATMVVHDGAREEEATTPTVTEVHVQDKAEKPEVEYPPASVNPVPTAARVGEPFAVNVDARALGDDSRLFAIVVPTGTPDMPANIEMLEKNTDSLDPEQLQIMFTAAVPGQNEVRLYYQPRNARVLAIAARGYISVAPAPQSPKMRKPWRHWPTPRAASAPPG